MQMTLEKLVIDGFKGAKNFIFAPNGGDAVVRGINGQGKTRIKDAWLWLWFDKDSADRSKFALKAIDQKNGGEVHNIVQTVEAHITVDGVAMVLEKSNKESYTKKRGGNTKSFTGNVNEFSIDGVPVPQKEWDKRLEDIYQGDKLRMSMDAAYFNNMPDDAKLKLKGWQRRRNILMSFCNPITDREVVDVAFSASCENSIIMSGIIEKRSIDDHKRMSVARKTKINDRTKEISPSIRELKAQADESSDYDVKAIEKTIKDLEAELQDIKDNNSLVKLRTKKTELQGELAKAKNDLDAATSKKQSGINNKVSTLNAHVSQLKNKKANIESDLDTLTRGINTRGKRLDKLRETFKVISSRTLTVNGSNLCPECGFNLLADMEKKALEAFNLQKSTDLEDNNKEGKEQNRFFKEDQASFYDTQEKLESLNVELEAKGKELQEAMEEKENMDMSPEEIQISKVISRVTLEISDVTQEMENTETPDTNPIEAQLKEERAKISKVDTAKGIMKRIEALKAEEGTLSAEFEKIEQELFLIDQFIITKVSLLDDNIDKHFDLVRWKMSDLQVNGAITETCIAMLDYVPYGTGMSRGQKLMIDLDTRKTLSAMYDMEIPLFIDDVDSLTSEIESDTQTFKLIADVDYPGLNISYE